MQQKMKETRIKKIKNPEPEKSNLIELISSEQNLLRSIIQNEGEITEEIAAQLEFVHQALLEKIDSYHFVLKSLEIEAEKYKNEGQFFFKTSQKIKKTIEHLKQKLKLAGSQREDHQLLGSKIGFNVSKGKSKVNLATEDAKIWFGKNYDDLIRQKVTYEFDKEAIRVALENGRELPFATLEEVWNLRRFAIMSLGKLTKKRTKK